MLTFKNNPQMTFEGTVVMTKLWLFRRLTAVCVDLYNQDNNNDNVGYVANHPEFWIVRCSVKK